MFRITQCKIDNDSKFVNMAIEKYADTTFKRALDDAEFKFNLHGRIPGTAQEAKYERLKRIYERLIASEIINLKNNRDGITESVYHTPSKKQLYVDYTVTIHPETPNKRGSITVTPDKKHYTFKIPPGAPKKSRVNAPKFTPRAPGAPIKSYAGAPMFTPKRTEEISSDELARRRAQSIGDKARNAMRFSDARKDRIKLKRDTKVASSLFNSKKIMDDLRNARMAERRRCHDMTCEEEPSNKRQRYY